MPPTADVKERGLAAVLPRGGVCCVVPFVVLTVVPVLACGGGGGCSGFSGCSGGVVAVVWCLVAGCRCVCVCGAWDLACERCEGHN